MEIQYDRSYDHLDELHKKDTLIKILREIEGESKLDLIKLMLKTKHNSRYNDNLLPTYLTIKEKFDKYVKEQQLTIENLEKIITHLDNILIEFIKKQGDKGKKHMQGKYNDTNNFIANIMKDKQHISKILIKMRVVLNKLNAVDSIVDIKSGLFNSLRVTDISNFDGYDEHYDNDNDDDNDVAVLDLHHVNDTEDDEEYDTENTEDDEEYDMEDDEDNNSSINENHNFSGDDNNILYYVGDYNND